MACGWYEDLFTYNVHRYRKEEMQNRSEVILPSNYDLQYVCIQMIVHMVLSCYWEKGITIFTSSITYMLGNVWILYHVICANLIKAIAHISKISNFVCGLMKAPHLKKTTTRCLGSLWPALYSLSVKPWGIFRAICRNRKACQILFFWNPTRRFAKY
jgi:hypothetical protein